MQSVHSTATMDPQAVNPAPVVFYSATQILEYLNIHCGEAVNRELHNLNIPADIFDFCQTSTMQAITAVVCWGYGFPPFGQYAGRFDHITQDKINEACTTVITTTKFFAEMRILMPKWTRLLTECTEFAISLRGMARAYLFADNAMPTEYSGYCETADKICDLVQEMYKFQLHFFPDPNPDLTTVTRNVMLAVAEKDNYEKYRHTIRNVLGTTFRELGKQLAMYGGASEDTRLSLLPELHRAMGAASGSRTAEEIMGRGHQCICTGQCKQVMF